MGINHYLPMKCIMSECPLPDSMSRANWIEPFLKTTNNRMPLFQDLQGAPTYEQFGGGHDDLFVYDGEGNLFAYLQSGASATLEHAHSVYSLYETDLQTPEGYASVRTTVLLAAATANATTADGRKWERCSSSSSSIIGSSGISGISGTISSGISSGTVILLLAMFGGCAACVCHSHSRGLMHTAHTVAAAAHTVAAPRGSRSMAAAVSDSSLGSFESEKTDVWSHQLSLRGDSIEETLDDISTL